MSLWGKVASANGAPKFKNIATPSPKSGGELYGNTTLGAAIAGQIIGVYGVDTDTANNNAARGLNSGWTLTKRGTGGVASALVTNAGASFANGELIFVSGGTSNATISAVTNSSGGLISSVVTNPGAGFVNVSSTTVTFGRQKHLSNVAVTAGGTGYSNTDYCLVANSITVGVFSLTTNSTGGVVSTVITDVGLWTSATTNTQVTFSPKSANGASSNGSGATFTANLISSTGGNVSITLGGRAGRLSAETIVAMGSIVADANTPFSAA